MSQGKKSRWPDWDLNPGTLTYSTSSLTTELPSHTVDLWHWSSVIFKFFSVEATRPIEAKFHVDFSWDGGTNVCSNGLGHMIKMVAMPIYGKNLQKSTSLKPNGWWPWNAASGTQVLPSMFKWWTWVDCDLFWAWPNFVPYAFVWEEGKTTVFYNIKVGRCTQLNETWSCLSTRGRGHSLTLVQISQIQYS